MEKRKHDDDEDARKKRQRKDGGKGGNEQHQTKFLPARDAQIQKLKEAESISKRRKLMLPPAQVGEAELEAIVKIGQAGEYARSLVAEGGEASERLLGDYDGLEAAKTARTPRTAPQCTCFYHRLTAGTDDRFAVDNVMAEARNLRNMRSVQTPLLGEENTPMPIAPGGGTGFESATPRHSVSFTPNPLATPLYRNGADASATPRIGGTPLRTPIRDNLNLNPDGSDVASKRALQSAFASLPKPANDFELVLPEDEEVEDDASVPLSEEDAAERDARIARKKAEEERKALARRTLPVQRGLPRPANVDVDRLLSNLPDMVAVPEQPADLADARKLIDIEVVRLLQHDSIAYPLPGTTRPGGTKSLYEHPADGDVATAKTLVGLEVAGMLGTDDPEEATRRLKELTISDKSDDSVSWASIRDSLAFDAQSKTWVDRDSLAPEARVAGLSYLLDEERNLMGREADRTNKQEKKLNVQLGGYQARSKALAKRLTDAFEALQKGKIDLESLVQLSVNEKAAAPRRVEALAMSVDKLERREGALQDRYRELAEEKAVVQARISALEEQLMEQAEALLDDAEDVAME